MRMAISLRFSANSLFICGDDLRIPVLRLVGQPILAAGRLSGGPMLRRQSQRDRRIRPVDDSYQREIALVLFHVIGVVPIALIAYQVDVIVAGLPQHESKGPLASVAAVSWPADPSDATARRAPETGPPEASSTLPPISIQWEPTVIRRELAGGPSKSNPVCSTSFSPSRAETG